MGTLILTSTGLTYLAPRTEFEQVAKTLTNRSVALVVTAALDKKRNWYVRIGKQQLERLGFAVDLVDLETDPDFDFSPYNVIYVGGGNTFYLLEYARRAQFAESVQALLDRGGVYVGVSAGSLIMCPDISVVAYTEGDPNEIGMTDFTALQLTDLYLEVHYEPDNEWVLASYEQEYQRHIMRLTDAQAVAIEDGVVRRIN